MKLSDLIEISRPDLTVRPLLLIKISTLDYKQCTLTLKCNYCMKLKNVPKWYKGMFEDKRVEVADMVRNNSGYDLYLTVHSTGTETVY